MRDFTLQKYRQLLLALQKAGYQFYTLEAYYHQRKVGFETTKFILLRHDVDLKASNSLSTARIEAELGICASYYFRVVPQSNQPNIIKAIANLGHEIGYHYEDMALCGGDAVVARAHFEKQLAYFRQFYPVKTICMHGAPQSKFDSKALWKTVDYHTFGIVGEPYFDVDYGDVFYLTDTGRRWDGFNVSVRDKIPEHQDEWLKNGLFFHTTDDIINAIEMGHLPDRVLITTHPQRWTDNLAAWLKEYGLQTVKNQVKRILIARKRSQVESK